MQSVGEVCVWICASSIDIMNDNKVGLRGILASKVKCPWKKFRAWDRAQREKKKGGQSETDHTLVNRTKGKKRSLTGRMGGARRAVRQGEERTALARGALVGLSSPPPLLQPHLNWNQEHRQWCRRKGAPTHDAMDLPASLRSLYLFRDTLRAFTYCFLSPDSEEVGIVAQ